MGRQLFPGRNVRQTPLYRMWINMTNRCLRPSVPKYKNYGGRGITVCEEWRTAKGFIQWAESNGYKPGLTIERKDVNGDYCPDNCTFIPMREQFRNKTDSHYVTLRGRLVTVTEAAHEIGLAPDVLFDRINRYGWSEERALSTPLTSYRKYQFRGREYTMKELASSSGINRGTLSFRINVLHMSVEDALTTPLNLSRSRRKHGRVA